MIDMEKRPESDSEGLGYTGRHRPAPGTWSPSVGRVDAPADPDEEGCICEDRQAQLAAGETIIVWHGSDCPRHWI